MVYSFHMTTFSTECTYIPGRGRVGEEQSDLSKKTTHTAASNHQSKASDGLPLKPVIHKSVDHRASIVETGAGREFPKNEFSLYITNESLFSQVTLLMT